MDVINYHSIVPSSYYLSETFLLFVRLSGWHRHHPVASAVAQTHHSSQQKTLLLSGASGIRAEDGKYPSGRVRGRVRVCVGTFLKSNRQRPRPLDTYARFPPSKRSRGALFSSHPLTATLAPAVPDRGIRICGDRATRPWLIRTDGRSVRSAGSACLMTSAVTALERTSRDKQVADSPRLRRSHALCPAGNLCTNNLHGQIANRHTSPDWRKEGGNNGLAGTYRVGVGLGFPWGFCDDTAAVSL